jgi:biotin carboxyl carrier protein
VKAALAIGAFCMLLLLGLGVIVASDSLEVESTADQLADAHEMILELTDSLRTVSSIDVEAEGSATQAGTARPKSATRPFRRSTEMGLSAPAPGVVLPVMGRITSRFSRSRFHPLLRIFRAHKGVDVAAPAGTRITAPAAGRVVFAGRKLGNGLMVELDHGEGVTSRYAHCSSLKVREGDFVSFGDMIATVGSSGLSTAPHVHFEVRVRGNAVDPLKYLITARVAPQGRTATVDASPTSAAPAGKVEAPSTTPVPPTTPAAATPAAAEKGHGPGAGHQTPESSVPDSAHTPGR